MNQFRNASVLRPFFSQHWRLFLLGIVILISVNLLQLFIPRLIGRAVDALLNSQTGLESYLIAVMAISVVIAVLRYVYRECIIGTTRRMEAWLRESIFYHAIRLPLSYYDEHGPGKVMALTTNDIAAVRIAVGFGTMLFIDAIIMGTASLFVMAQYIDWELTLLATIPLPVVLLAATVMGKTVHMRFRTVQEKFSDLTEFTQEVLAGATIIKGFAVEGHVMKRFYTANQDNVKANLQLAFLQAAYMPITHIAPLICYAIALYVGGTLIMEGVMSVGDFAAFTGYLGLIIWPVMGLGYLINTVQRGTASLYRIQDFLAQPLIEREEDNVPGFVKPPTVTVRNLTFQYPRSSVPSLQQVNLTIRPGTVVGIVGGAGAGKTTLLKLLLRLYDPPDSTIFLDDRDITTIDYVSLRESIAYIPQESFLFSRTIGDNISFAVDATRQQIEDAARLAAVREDIDEKPFGYATVLGEKGKRLSGGQQQRVAIARALIKEKPLLLMDDVFSALDYHTQANLLTNLRPILAGRTVLMISQRITAVKEADLILVLEQGTIAEQGTHKELIERKGLYFKLYEQQLVDGAE